MENTYDTAEALINDTVEGSTGSPNTLLTNLNKEAETLEVAEAAKVRLYVNGVRGAVQGMIVADLEAGVGGRYTGDHMEIAEGVLQVGESIEATVAQVTETGDHEKYHSDHKHLEAMKLGDSAEGGSVVTIGNEAFSDTRMVEALTVHDTGMEFVSSEYVEHEQRVSQALIRASLGWDDVRQAINVRKDYGVIDDASRGVTESAPALAA